jgi:AAA15 family ATPase/GTPase
VRSADLGITDLQVEDGNDPRSTKEAALLDSEIADLKERVHESTDITEFSQFDRRLESLARRRRIARRVNRKIALRHGTSGVTFRLDDESAGTRAWLQLLPSVLDTLDEGRVLVVDEIDTSLHPLLTARLIELFQDETTNPRRAQLIFTSHDSSLLGTAIQPGGLLKRDQVWFVRKEAEGRSSLYPLTDFTPRNEHNIERRYLAGAYGAVPEIDPADFSDVVRGHDQT